MLSEMSVCRVVRYMFYWASGFVISVILLLSDASKVSNEVGKRDTLSKSEILLKLISYCSYWVVVLFVLLVDLMLKKSKKF